MSRKKHVNQISSCVREDRSIVVRFFYAIVPSVVDFLLGSHDTRDNQHQRPADQHHDRPLLIDVVDCPHHQGVAGGGPSRKQKTCPVKGCKVKLGPSNTYECERCRAKVCISHRYEEDHDCTARRDQFKPGGMLAAATSQPLRPAQPHQPGRNQNFVDPARLEAQRAARAGAPAGGGRHEMGVVPTGGSHQQNFYGAGTTPTDPGDVLVDKLNPRPQLNGEYKANGNPLSSLARKKKEYVQCPDCSLHNPRGCKQCGACGRDLGKDRGACVCM